MVMKCVDELPANKEAIKCFHTRGGQVSITHYAITPPAPSPQAMNRAAKWRRKQNELINTFKAKIALKISE